VTRFPDRHQHPPATHIDASLAMAESARKKQRLSPQRALQRSSGHDASIEPMTPFRRPISAGPTPASRRTPVLRTPASGATPRGGPATRPLPPRRVAPTTPHAIRALRERANAARTPANNRRRSGRIQRETPRDILRHLSRGTLDVNAISHLANCSCSTRS
jgi:hypothetical protein